MPPSRKAKLDDPAVAVYARPHSLVGSRRLFGMSRQAGSVPDLFGACVIVSDFDCSSGRAGPMTEATPPTAGPPPPDEAWVGGLRLSRRPQRLRRSRAGQTHRHPGRGRVSRGRRPTKSGARSACRSSTIRRSKSVGRPLRRRSCSTGKARPRSTSASFPSPGGGVAIGGAGEVLEWATQMRRFDENATLDRLAERGELTPISSPGSRRDPRDARARAQGDGEPAVRSLETYLDQNETAFAERSEIFDPSRAADLNRLSREALAAQRRCCLPAASKAMFADATAICTFATS